MKFCEIELPEGSMKVSKIVLGTDYFGTTVARDTAFKLMDMFIGAGGNCLDTARVYAAWLPEGKGASEKLIGQWLKDRNIRNKIIISTKGGHPLIGRMDQGRLSKECLESDLNESLNAMMVDHIDVYWLHRDDKSLPAGEIMENLYGLVKSGKVRAIGCSNWTVDRIDEANTYAAAHGLMPFVSSQIQWSLAESTPDMHQDPTIVCMNNYEYNWYAAHKMPVMAFSSQAKGFFTRGAVDLEKLNDKARSRFLTEENLSRLKRVKEYSKKSNLTPTAVSLGYITCNELPAMAIVGCKNEDQMVDTLTAADISLSDEAVKWLHQG